MILHFHISEFFKLDGQSVEILDFDTAQKVIRYHMIPLNSVRLKMDMAIYVRSSVRPKWWEIIKGRKPGQGRDEWSQHCFEGNGATDASLEETSASRNLPAGSWQDFFNAICQCTDYKRIAYYPNLRFFHLDYKSEDRKFYNGESWIEISRDQLESLLK